MIRRLYGHRLAHAIVLAALGSPLVAPISPALAQTPAPAPTEHTAPSKPQVPLPPLSPAQPTSVSIPQSGTSAIVMDLSALESVIGKSVKSSTGEDLGRIVDLLVTTSGQVRAAVIDFGGVLGVGSRKVAVDWKALDFGNFTKDGTVRLALTRNQVRVSPEYKSGDPVVILQASSPADVKSTPVEAKAPDAKTPSAAPAASQPQDASPKK